MVAVDFNPRKAIDHVPRVAERRLNRPRPESARVARGASIPQIPLLILDAVPIEQFAILLLVGTRAVMLALVANIG